MLTSQKPLFSTNYSRNGAKEVFGESTISTNCLYLLHTYLLMYNPCRQKNNKLPTPPHLFDVSICATAFFSLHNKDTFAICRQARPSAISTWMDCCWSGHMFAHYLGATAAEQRRGGAAMRR